MVALRTAPRPSRHRAVASVAQRPPTRLPPTRLLGARLLGARLLGARLPAAARPGAWLLGGLGAATVLAAALLLLLAPAADSNAGEAAATVPPDADVLVIHPVVGVAPEALHAALGARGVDVLPVGAYDAAVRARVPAGADAPALARDIAGDGLVRAVEPDTRVQATRQDEEAADETAGEPEGVLRPDDPLYLHHQARYLETIRAPEAWAALEATDVANHPPVIAIIDTGVDWNHPDLIDQIFINWGERFLTGRDESNSGCPDDIAGCNFVTPATADPSCGYHEEAPNWRAMDDDGHGTFVAGLAAAPGNNGQGIAGIAWNAQILPVKVLDCTATGRISEAAAGIRYAARMGADVINVSFGTRSDSLVLREAVEEAQALGALIVASAGNDGQEGITFPAAYPGVVAVAASGTAPVGGIVDYHATAEFANFGDRVDVIAPGRHVMGTVPPALCGERGWACHSEGPYAISSGSSFATPLVSGAAALLRARYPWLSGEFVGQLVVNAGQPGRTAADARVLDLAAAISPVIHNAAVPGTSHSVDGDPDTSPAGPAVEP